jgi:uncharacterized protein (DUF1684 family)
VTGSAPTLAHVPIDWSTDALLADYRRRVVENYLAEPITGEEGWLAFRRRRDRLFLTHPRSALDDEQKAATPSLPYFPYSAQARVQTLIRPVGAESQELTIDTGGQDGVLRFSRLAHLATAFGTLTLFWLKGYGGGLFLPFRDATSGRETYGAGRYLTDTAKGTFGRGVTIDGEVAVLDFNYAYNPSCAYNALAACPLAPPENRLSARVEAGELTFPLPH